MAPTEERKTGKGRWGPGRRAVFSAERDCVVCQCHLVRDSCDHPCCDHLCCLAWVSEAWAQPGPQSITSLPLCWSRWSVQGTSESDIVRFSGLSGNVQQVAADRHQSLGPQRLWSPCCLISLSRPSQAPAKEDAVVGERSVTPTHSWAPSPSQAPGKEQDQQAGPSGACPW